MNRQMNQFMIRSMNLQKYQQAYMPMQPQMLPQSTYQPGQPQPMAAFGGHGHTQQSAYA